MSFTWTQNPTAGTLLSSGAGTTHTVTVTADDGNGNTADCTVVLTGDDTTPPTITCPTDQNNAPALSFCSAVVTGIDAVYSDNCSGAALTYVLSGATTGSGSGQVSGSTFNTGTTTVTYTVTDGGGLTGSCDFTVTIDDCVEISGQILWEDNLSPVKDVSVDLFTLPGLALVDNMLTGADGTYTVTAGPTGDYRVKPSKAINLLNGVTAADATRIQQHITNTPPLPTPYKRIAADVNKSNSITTYDATLVGQAIAGNPAALAVFNTSWRFVPQAYTFPNPKRAMGLP